MAGKDGNFYDIVCYNCDRHGHISYNCPEVSKKGINITQMRLTLTQSNDGENDLINENWILLDTCSTVNVCKNVSIVTGVRKCHEGEELTIVTNGGSQKYDQIGFFKYLSLPIYYNPKSIANILSLKQVASVPDVRITMDTFKERAIFVTLPDGKKMKFKECDNGLYYYDTKDELKLPNNKSIKEEVKSYSKQVNFLSTVAENKSLFSRKEIQGAKNARILQQALCMAKYYNLQNIC